MCSCPANVHAAKRSAKVGLTCRYAWRASNFMSYLRVQKSRSLVQASARARARLCSEVRITAANYRSSCCVCQHMLCCDVLCSAVQCHAPTSS